MVVTESAGLLTLDTSLCALAAQPKRLSKAFLVIKLLGRYLYHGESNRTIVAREEEHIQAYNAKKSESWMWSHTKECHNSEIGPDKGRRDFTFEPIKSFPDAFTRIIDESVRLSREEREVANTGGNGKYVCMNRKGEYFVTKEVRQEFHQL